MMRRARRGVVVLGIVAAIVAAPARAHAQDVPAELTPQLAALFEAARGVLEPLGPASSEAGAVIAELSATFEEQAAEGGEAIVSVLGPLAVQLTGALAQLQAAIADGTSTLSDSLAEFESAAASVAELLKTIADTSSSQLAEQEPALRQLGAELAPVLGQLCAATTATSLISGFVGYSYAVQGLFVPLDEACGEEEDDSEPPVDFDAVAAEAGALSGEVFAVLEPFSDLMRPLAEPVCVAFSPVLVVSVLAGGALPIPLPVGSVASPVSVVCAFGEGPDALEGLLLLTAQPLDASVPLLEGAASSTSALRPLTDLLEPIHGPVVGPLCELGPLGELLGGVAIPLQTPIRPLALVTSLTLPFCAEVEAQAEQPSTNDPTPIPVAAPPPSTPDGTFDEPQVRTITTTIPGEDGPPSQAVDLSQPEVAQPASSEGQATWLAILAFVLVGIAAIMSVLPPDATVRRVLRLVG